MGYGHNSGCEAEGKQITNKKHMIKQTETFINHALQFFYTN